MGPRALIIESWIEIDLDIRLPIYTIAVDIVIYQGTME